MTDLRYRDKLEIGVDGNLITPTVILTKRSCKEIGVIRNIKNFRANHPMGDTAEISFDVYKYVNGEKTHHETTTTHKKYEPLTNCPNCGQPIDKVTSNCEYCGTLLQDNIYNEQ